MHVVVLGGGYAGLTLARRLESRLAEARSRDAGQPAVDITLVDATGTHLVQHELHRAIRRPSVADAITVPLDAVLDDVTVRQARVQRVHPHENEVVLADGDRLAYDYAAVCLGAEPAFYGLPGVEEHATPLKCLSHARTIRERFLDVCDRGGSVVVGGAGLAGVQVAGELAALAREQGASVGDRDSGSSVATEDSATVTIHLLEQMYDVAPEFPDEFQGAVREELTARGIDVRTQTTVLEAGAEYVAFEDHSGDTTEDGRLAYDQFVWTGGIAGTAAMENQRPRVRSDLRLTDSTFVLGDAAQVIDAEGRAVPPSAATAIREARTVADNLATLVDHELAGDGFAPRLDPYRLDVPGWIVSVGDGAVAQVGPQVLTGTAAKAMKATVGAGHLRSVGAIRQAVDLVEEEIRAGQVDAE